MWNIFEQPWALLFTAVLVLIITAILRAVFSPDKKWRQWLPTIIIILAAFGLDYFIKSDFEKIKIVISAGSKAFAKESCTDIGKVLAEDYNDSFHKNKDSVLYNCKTILRPPLISKIYSSILQKDIQADKAEIVLLSRVVIDENSQFYSFSKIMLIKTKVELQKGPDKNWLISRIEVLEINKQPAKWSDINYSEW